MFLNLRLHCRLFHGQLIHGHSTLHFPFSAMVPSVPESTSVCYRLEKSPLFFIGMFLVFEILIPSDASCSKCNPINSCCARMQMQSY